MADYRNIFKKMKPIYHTAIGAITILFILFSVFITGLWTNYFLKIYQTDPVSVCTHGIITLLWIFIPVSICYVVGKIVIISLFEKN